MKFCPASRSRSPTPYLLDSARRTDKLYGGGKFIPNVCVIDEQGIIRWQRVMNMDLAAAEVIVGEVENVLASAVRM